MTYTIALELLLTALLAASCSQKLESTPLTAQPRSDRTHTTPKSDLDILIATRGSITFRSFDGNWMGSDVDTDLNFSPDGKVELIEYGDAFLSYSGTYTIGDNCEIQFTFPTRSPAWPKMSLRRDEKSFLLRPVNPEALRKGYWPFRPRQGE